MYPNLPKGLLLDEFPSSDSIREDSAGVSTADPNSPHEDENNEMTFYYSEEHILPHNDGQNPHHVSESEEGTKYSPYSPEVELKSSSEEEQHEEGADCSPISNQCRSDVIEKVIQRFALRKFKRATRKALAYRNRRKNSELLLMLTLYAEEEMERRGVTEDLDLFVAELGSLIHGKTFLSLLKKD